MGNTSDACECAPLWKVQRADQNAPAPRVLRAAIVFHTAPIALAGGVSVWERNCISDIVRCVWREVVVGKACKNIRKMHGFSTVDLELGAILMDKILHHFAHSFLAALVLPR